MIRALKFLSIPFAIIVFVALASRQDTLHLLGKAFIDAEQPNTITRVKCEHSNGETEHGTGVLIRSDLVLTCNHVVRDRETNEASVVFKDGLERVGQVIKTDKVWDLALIQFDSVLLPPARPATQAARRNDVVTIGGFPSANEYKEVTGRVIGFLSPTPNTPNDLFMINDKCASGMSGGPAFNDDGEVVGILFGSRRFAHCVGLSQIKEFVHEATSVPRQDRAHDHTGPDSETDGGCPYCVP